MGAYETATVLTEKPAIDPLGMKVEGYEVLHETASDYSERLAERETLSEFIGSILTARQAEVLDMAKEGEVKKESSENKIFKGLSNGIFNHPAFVTRSASILGTSISELGEEAWKEKAACIGDIRYVQPLVKSPKVKKELRDICSDCPVYDACLGYVEERRPKKGVWAGIARNTNSGSGYNEDGTPITLEQEVKN